MIYSKYGKEIPNEDIVEWDTDRCEECEHFFDNGMSFHFRCCVEHSTCVDCWNCEGRDFATLKR